MLDTVIAYQELLSNIDVHIEQSKFKKEYLIEQLGISRASFYSKLKKKSFSVAEMAALGKVLFPEELRDLEIKEALARSEKDSLSGRTREHKDVISDARKRIKT